MEQRYIYLDTSASVRLASDAALTLAAKAYIVGEGLVLVVGAMNLMELVSWPKRWSEVVSFVSSVPFCIAQNADRIAAREIESYPNELTALPVGYCSSDHSFSVDDLRGALSLHLQGKIADSEREFRTHNEETLRTIVSKRETFLPEKPGHIARTKRSPLGLAPSATKRSADTLAFQCANLERALVADPGDLVAEAHPTAGEMHHEHTEHESYQQHGEISPIHGVQTEIVREARWHHGDHQKRDHRRPPRRPCRVRGQLLSPDALVQPELVGADNHGRSWTYIFLDQ